MSKKEIAARFLSSRVGHRVWTSTGSDARVLRVLAYHRVIDDDPSLFPFDEGVISATTDSFYRQMRFARSNFDVISFGDLYLCEVEGRPWPARPLIITFDDGYRDNYTRAFPILKEMGLGATVFLTTGHIGRRELFWWDKIAYCIKRTRLRSVTFPEISASPLPLSNSPERAAAIENILWWVKRVSEEVKQGFLESLSRKLEVSVAEDAAEGMHLSWEEVRQMAAGGVEFGSHTVTHPILANVSGTQLVEEVLGSKKKIEAELGKEIISMAYPVGRSSKFTRLAQETVARSGFRYGVSYDEGVVVEGEFDRYAMPRIPVESDHTLNLFKAKLMFPRWMLGHDRPYASQERRADSQASTGV